MSYDIDDFKIGDLVKYISECHDHEDALERWSDCDFYVGGQYIIRDIVSTATQHQILLDLGEDDWGDEMCWWVSINHLQPIKELGDRSNPYWKVIRKIKQMDLKRKERGYAF